MVALGALRVGDDDDSDLIGPKQEDKRRQGFRGGAAVSLWAGQGWGLDS